MTRSVAVARALVVTAVLWGLGAALVVGLFGYFDASATIRLPQQDRAQVVWLGAHAFVACVAALAGVVLGGLALTRQHVSSAREAVVLVALPTLGVMAAVALGAAAGGALDGAAVPAVLAGLLIGTVAAVGYLLYTGEPVHGPERAPAGRPASRGWGSR